MSFDYRRALWSVGVTILMVAFAGCSSSEPIELSHGEYRELNNSLYSLDSDIEMRMQEAVARCMIDQGFEYIAYVAPVDNSGAESLSPVTDSLESSLRDWLDPQSVDDPNQAILDALSGEDPAAAFQYEQALWGSKDELGIVLPDDGFDSIDLSVEALGCQNYSAIEVTGGEEALKAEYEIAGIQTEIHERVTADQRFIDAVSEVRECVDESDAGRAEKQFVEAFDELEAEAFDLDPAEIDPRFNEVRRLEVAFTEVERECELASGIDSLYDELGEEVYETLPEDRISKLRPLIDRATD